MVRLMHATPYIADALKVAFPLALVGSIVGEFIGGNKGGYRIVAASFSPLRRWFSPRFSRSPCSRPWGSGSLRHSKTGS
jgi:hypothetical protein